MRSLRRWIKPDAWTWRMASMTRIARCIGVPTVSISVKKVCTSTWTNAPLSRNRNKQIDFYSTHLGQARNSNALWLVTSRLHVHLHRGRCYFRVLRTSAFANGKCMCVALLPWIFLRTETSRMVR